MRRLLIILIFLLASVWLGAVFIDHPGYVFLVYQPWLVEMPLWFAALSLILILFLFYLILQSIDRLHFVWFRLRNWLDHRQEHQSLTKTQRGLITLIEGGWRKAERLLLAGVNQSMDPLINYLGAAKAAHELKAYDRRDEYLQKAHRIAPHAELAIGITQAQLQLAQDQLEQAVATLTHLRHLDPYHVFVLQLLEKCYVRLGDWPNLLTLLTPMRKAKIITPEEKEHFEKNLYCELLQTPQTRTLVELQQFWDTLPKTAKRHPEVILTYIHQLHRFPDTTPLIEELIRKALKREWQPQLVMLYGTLDFDINKQLVVAGAWQKLYGQEHLELLFTLGRLCVRNQLWGKAREYFDQCLVLSPKPEIYMAYGKLLDQLGQQEAAKEMYAEGLRLVATDYKGITK